MKDLFGKAMLDYQMNNSPEDLITETSISEADEMSVAYLFRGFTEMPEIERQALELARGKVLDVGCGAGSHSLYLQQKGFDVHSVDISPAAIEVCRLRGLKNAINADLMTITGTFDTILLLMNGAGMCGKLSRIDGFLEKLKGLLAPGGQILLDSSDIIYMFDDDPDGGKWIHECDYYGEVLFHVRYKGQTEEPFEWMYIDFNTLVNASAANGLKCERVVEGEHYDYLARLTVS